MFKYMGFKIHISPMANPKPKLEMSLECRNMFRKLGTPEHIDSFHAWSREFFGEEEVMFVDLQTNSVYVSERNYHKLFNFINSIDSDEETTKLADRICKARFAQNRQKARMRTHYEGVWFEEDCKVNLSNLYKENLEVLTKEMRNKFFYGDFNNY